MKITLPPDLLSKDAYNVFTLTVTDGTGKVGLGRLGKTCLHGIVAATNTKQRTRMGELYLAAERLNYFVCGMTNKTEDLQGFSVKYGNGVVDVEPIAHLFKVQAFQLARHLGVIGEIINWRSSPDTYNLGFRDEKFFFRIPFNALALPLYAWESKVPLEDVTKVMGLSQDQVQRASRDITSKFNAAAHIRQYPPRPEEAVR